MNSEPNTDASREPRLGEPLHGLPGRMAVHYLLRQPTIQVCRARGVHALMRNGEGVGVNVVKSCRSQQPPYGGGEGTRGSDGASID